MFKVFLAILFVVCAALPAAARPRDEAMAGAYRCAAVGDSRIWLDCYYGAAQPMRAALGLSPAPASQVQLAISPPAGEPRDTDTREAVMAGAFHCNTVLQDRGWLDCYYGAAQPMRTLLGLSPAPQMAMAVPLRPNGRPPQAAEPPVGSWLLGSGAKAMVSRMTSYTFDSARLFTVTLENGQAWRQMPGDTNHPRWNKPAASYVAVVSRGALGSTNFEVRGDPELFKVERVK